MIKTWITRPEFKAFEERMEVEGDTRVYIFTKEELEQLQREAFEAGIDAVHPHGHRIEKSFEQYWQQVKGEG